MILSVTDFKRNYDAVECVNVSFQLRISNGSELKAIDISFVKQFAVPVFLLVLLIMVLSLFLGRSSDVSHVWQEGGSSAARRSIPSPLDLLPCLGPWSLASATLPARALASIQRSP